MRPSAQLFLAYLEECMQASIRLLCIAIGLEAMFAAFFTISQKPIPLKFYQRLTNVGHHLFRPERDLPIYVASCIAIVLATVLVSDRWRRTSPRNGQGSVAGGWKYSLLVSGIALGGAGTFCIVSLQQFWQKDGICALDSPQGAAVCGIGTALLIALQILLASTVLRSQRLQRKRVDSAEPQGSDLLRSEVEQERSLPASPSGKGGNLIDSVLIALLFSCLFVPDTHRLVGISLGMEGFHHINFFVASPALAFLQGKALGTEAYAQYGVGWPLVFTALSPVLPFGYSAIMTLFSLVNALYFCLIFFFLRSVGLSRPMVWIGTLAAIFFQMFTGLAAAPTLGIFPSATIMRSPFDITLLILLWRHMQTRQSGYWFAASVVTALAVLFETDTGAYLIAVFTAYVVILSLRSANGSLTTLKQRIQILAGALGKWLIVFFPILLAGLALAGRGTILQPAFWRGWLECMLIYPGGMSFLPIIPRPEIFLNAFFLFWLSLYLISSQIDRLRKRTEPLTVLCCLISLLGMLYNLQYIGRSHPANLMHGIVPLVLVSTIESAPFLERLWKASKITVRLVVLAGFICYAALPVANIATNRALWEHPSLFSRLLPSGIIGNLFDRFGFTEGEGDIPLNVDATGREDVLLPPRQAEWASGFHAAVAEIKARASRGQRVAVLDNADTDVYLAAGIAPWDRYSPLLPQILTSDDLARLKGRLDRGEADVVFISRPGLVTNSSPDSRDVLEALRAELGTRYRRIGFVGDFEVYTWRGAAQS